jgi:hypothetical protein
MAINDAGKASIIQAHGNDIKFTLTYLRTIHRLPTNTDIEGYVCLIDMLETYFAAGGVDNRPQA